MVLTRGICERTFQSSAEPADRASVDLVLILLELTRWPSDTPFSVRLRLAILAVGSCRRRLSGARTRQVSGIKPGPVNTSTAAGKTGSSLAPRTAAREHRRASVSVATPSYRMHWRGPSCAGSRMRTRRPVGDENPRTDKEPSCQLGPARRSGIPALVRFRRTQEEAVTRHRGGSQRACCFRSMTAFKAVNNRVTTRRKPWRSSGPLRSPRESTRAPGNGSISASNPGNRRTHDIMGASVAAIAIGAAPGNGLAGTEGDSRERLDSLRTYLKTALRDPKPSQSGLAALGFIEYGRSIVA